MSRRLLAALLLVFLATVVARFPARWALAMAPRGFSCATPAGSAWHGSCLGLEVAGQHVDELAWQLHPASLLRGRLGLSLQASDRRLAARGDIELGFGGRIAVHALSAALPLDASVLPMLPRGWLGQLQVDLAEGVFEHGRPSGLAGTIAVQSLRQLSPPLELGGYTLRFAAPADANGRQRGELTDTGGPLAVAGTVVVGGDGQYEVEGTVAARAELPADFERTLGLLGPADASGRRPFSFSGTL